MCIPFLAPIGVALGASESAAAAAGTMAVLSVAATAASAGVSYAGQKQAADSQKYQYQEGQRLAQENLQLQYQQVGVRQREEQISKAQQVQQIRQEAESAFGSIRTTTGEAGIQGNSVNMLMAEFSRQQNESIANVNLNYDFRSRQLMIEQLGMQGQADGTMIRSYPTTTAPSPLAPALQIGGGVLGAINQYGNVDKMNFGTGSAPSANYSTLARREAFMGSIPTSVRMVSRGWYNR